MNKFTRSDDPDYRLVGDEIERLRDSGIAERYRASREASGKRLSCVAEQV